MSTAVIKLYRPRSSGKTQASLCSSRLDRSLTLSFRRIIPSRSVYTSLRPNTSFVLFNGAGHNCLVIQLFLSLFFRFFFRKANSTMSTSMKALVTSALLAVASAQGVILKAQGKGAASLPLQGKS